jgi:tRNA acetyltransferase TAN1
MLSVVYWNNCYSRRSHLDLSLVLFFKTRPPIVPETFVHHIVQDAAESSGIKTSRWVRRLSPMTMMGKATEEGLEKVAKAVLAPHFHQENNAPRKVCS